MPAEQNPAQGKCRCGHDSVHHTSTGCAFCNCPRAMSEAASSSLMEDVKRAAYDAKVREMERGA